MELTTKKGGPMGKLHVRIDDRLIHGQIITAWSKSLNIGSIIAIDNEMSKNKMIADILIMGVPLEYNPRIVSHDEAMELVNEDLKTKNVMLITRFAKNLKDMVDILGTVSEVNIGNMSKQKDSIYISKKIGVGQVLCFSQEDIDTLDNLESSGIKVVTQQMPSDKEISWAVTKNNLQTIK